MLKSMLPLSSFFLAFAALGGPALAQAGNDLGGPLVPGVCVLSRDAVFANAKVGKAAFGRYQQLENEAEAELAALRNPIQQDAEKYRASAGSLSTQQRQTQEAALGAKFQQIQARADQLKRELDATRAKLLERLSGEMLPVVSQSYKQKGCGLLIDRATVIGGNMGNDLTATVIQGLDAKISTITFNRESLPSVVASEPALQ